MQRNKKFQKSEITMEVGGWVQVSLGIFFGKIIPKYLQTSTDILEYLIYHNVFCLYISTVYC